MTETTQKKRRYSLWQTAIGLVVLAILATMLAPDVGGLLRSSEEKAYDADRRLLKNAVETWRNEKAGKQRAKAWPTMDGTVGMPDLPKVNTFIDIGLLAQGRYLKSADAVASADKTKNSTATSGGSYGWYVDNGGSVSSLPPFVEGKYR